MRAILSVGFLDSGVAGIDPDPNVLTVAKRKAAKKLLDIQFIRASAEDLPFNNKSLDVVTSSLALHHMPTTVKNKSLSEIVRVLKNDGTFILVDIGKPKNRTWKLLCGLEALVEPKEYIKDNLEGRIPQLLTEAGFKTIAIDDPYMGVYTWKCKIDE